MLPTLARSLILSADEIDKLAEILMMPGKAVSVEQGMEIPVTHDIGTIRLDGDQGNSGVGIPSSRLSRLHDAREGFWGRHNGTRAHRLQFQASKTRCFKRVPGNGSLPAEHDYSIVLRRNAQYGALLHP